jgi:hypothetical protein
MKNLSFQVRIDSTHITAETDRGAVARDLVRQLRLLATHIEDQGSFSALSPALDLSGDDGAAPEVYELMADPGVCIEVTVAPSGCRCQPNVQLTPEESTARVVKQLDAIMHATACVFPADLKAAAGEHAAATGDWSGLDCAQAFALIRNRSAISLLGQYQTAYGGSVTTDKQVIARALATVMGKAS